MSSRLQGKYSVQNLKTLKAKVEAVESLYRDHDLQRKIHKTYKSLRKHSDMTTQADLKRLFEKISEPSLNKYALKFYIV